MTVRIDTLRHHKTLLLFLVWSAFMARGFFYCLAQPVWEGFDEWAHFDCIQHLAQHGRLPGKLQPVSGQVRRSLELAPLSESGAAGIPEALTHDAFWQLTAGQRLERSREFGRLAASHEYPPNGSAGPTQYEAQQPPLYYWLMALVYLAASGSSLPAQVIALRLASLGIASITILLGYAIARQFAATARLAVWVAVLLAALPGFAIDVCHIGNDCLAITLASAVTLWLFRATRRNSSMGDWVAVGLLLTAGLLTKTYVLALVPLFPLVALMEPLRRNPRVKRTLAGCALTLTMAALGAGWFYLHTWEITGTLSGEQIHGDAAHVGLATKLAAAGKMNWLNVLDTAFRTHVWVGGWSFLQARSWMYRVFAAIALLAAVGVVALAVRAVLRAVHRRTLGDAGAQLAIIAGAYLPLCLGLADFSLIVFLMRGKTMAFGWYLYGVVAAEMVLLAAGFTGLFGIRGARRCLAATVVLVLALDLYTVNFVLAPYYTGLIRRRPDGLLEAFRVADLARTGVWEVFTRLSMNKAGFGPAWMAAAWAAYACATVGLMAGSVFAAARWRRGADITPRSARTGSAPGPCRRCL